MPSTLDSAHGAARDSATVVLLRDGAAGLEVFLLQRSGLSDTFGAAYVFPGGKLDAHDSASTTIARLDTPAALLAQQLGEAGQGEPERSESVAAGLFVAALRELFEEAGVLFSGGGTRPASNRPEDWLAWLASPQAQLQASALAPWSRWITPRMAALSTKRFDTRFFLALAPTDQVARHDNFETTASIWLTPKAALQRYHRGEMDMAPPQIMSLAHLSRYATAAEALHAARQQTPPCICPERFTQDGEVILCYPGDPEHSVAQRALPGPTRLTLRNQRFVPAGGPESFWALEVL